MYPARVVAESDDAFGRVLARLRAVGCAYRHRSAESVRAQCPAHADLKPSLVITHRDGRVLMRCFAGCKVSAIVRRLDLKLADLFDEPTSERVPPVIIATYPYTDIDGHVIAEKVRCRPKRFFWRVPGIETAGLHGRVIGLYRTPDLIDARHVLIVEGEKAVERLRGVRIAATCPPAGAGHWHPSYTDTLWRLGVYEVVIFPDADQAGRRHAERVAASCYGFAGDARSNDHQHREPWAAWPCARVTDADVAALKVKVVHLPDLPAGGDVVDYLERHDASELRQLIANAPYWYPGCNDERRRERRREQTRERVRRHRERHRLTCNAPNVRTVTAQSCNAPYVSTHPVTRNAVTHPERTSVHITNTCTKEERAA